MILWTIDSEDFLFVHIYGFTVDINYQKCYNSKKEHIILYNEQKFIKALDEL